MSSSYFEWTKNKEEKKSTSVAKTQKLTRVPLVHIDVNKKRGGAISESKVPFKKPKQQEKELIIDKNSCIVPVQPVVQAAVVEAVASASGDLEEDIQQQEEGENKPIDLARDFKHWSVVDRFANLK